MNCKESERLVLWTGVGLGIGAGLMYLLDPDRGRRRRALLRDKAVSTAHRVEDSFGRTLRDLDHRARGLAAEARNVVRREGAAPDDVIEARVHAEMGHVVSHPGAIHASCTNGTVLLAGLVLKDEVERLRQAVRHVKGVEKVTDWLCEAESPEHISSLQGGVARTGSRPDLLQTRWSPTTRFLVGTAGAGLSLYAARERGWRRFAAGMAGAALVARAINNRSLPGLAGFGGESASMLQ
jgi:osmotically-inducible protein OsmY